MAQQLDKLVTVLRKANEEDVKSGAWKDPMPAGFSQEDVKEAAYDRGLIQFMLNDGNLWYASPDELNPREVSELLDWAEGKAVYLSGKHRR